MKRFARIWSLCIFVACCQWHAVAIAEVTPLWELGLDIFAVKLPAYRGSAENSDDVLPTPYVVYRGEYLKADQDGVRGVLFDSDLFEISLSVAASLPVNSGKIRVRRQGHA